MPSWQVTADPATGGFTYRLTGGHGHALFASILENVFRVLRVSASVTKNGLWWAIHEESSVVAFEIEHGVAAERYAYNDRVMNEAGARRVVVRGEHAGHCDLFVPVVMGGDIVATVVVGPFALERPNARNVLQRWHALTGRQGDPADPEFSAFFLATQSTLVLEGDRSREFERLLACLVRLLGERGRADAIMNEADELRRRVEPARLAERTWDAVQAMIDDRSPKTWSTAQRAYSLYALGLAHAPDDILVGLTVSRDPTPEPVDEAIRRDAFQRACVELGRASGGALAGRVGDHGVVFVVATRGKAAQKKNKLRELADRASSVAQRRFGLSLHFGAAMSIGDLPLSRSYEAALGAAESARARRERLVMVGSDATDAVQPLRRLRAELGSIAEERPASLAARFDRYLESVALHSGYRAEIARGYLDAGFERTVEPLIRSGGMDARSYAALCQALDRTAGDARTLSELFAAYRRAVSDVVAAVEAPLPARRDRSVRRAVDHLRHHYTEPLDLRKLARLAGFAPYYFSRLFRAREHTSVGDYVTRLRIERAKQLLADTPLPVGRVAELCGFRSAQYFCRVFKRLTRTTPVEHRATLSRRGARKTIRTTTKAK